MNREIKFRAFLESSKEMFYDVSVIEKEFFISRFGNDGKLFRTPITHSFVPCFVREDFENLMQFTGLEDRNGKQIYEGDLVKSLVYNEGEIYKIIWEDALSIYPFQYYMQSEDFEIIGNIYENPELLV